MKAPLTEKQWNTVAEICGVEFLFMRTEVENNETVQHPYFRDRQSNTDSFTLEPWETLYEAVERIRKEKEA